MDTMIEKIFMEHGLIHQKKSNYVPRESQIAAADELYAAIRNGRHMLMEGPCGFGKTFAYLFPLFAYLTNEGFGERCVIATNGIALSEQLIYKDLPLVSSIFKDIGSGVPKYALLKGKGNFVCQRKFNEALLTDDPETHSEDGIKIKAIINDTTSTGDLSTLGFKLSLEAANAFVCQGEDECQGRKCPCFSRCYYQKHKKEAIGSDIIVTNYHILFSDWKLGENGFLPKYNLLIMDEAHEVPNIFRDFTERKCSSRAIALRIKKLNKILDKLPKSDNLFESSEDHSGNKRYQIVSRMEDLQKEMKKMEMQVDSSFGQYETFKIIRENDIISHGAEISNIVHELMLTFDRYAEDYLKHIDNKYGEDALSEVLNMQLLLANYSDYFSEIAILFAGSWSEEEQRRRVYYYENQNGNISIGTKYIKVDEILYSSFFADPALSCILTSATLSTNNNFEFIKGETGLHLVESSRVTEFIGQSPFDLEHQQLWYMPEGAVEGSSKDFEESMEVVVPEIINATMGGVLFLCTSYKNMKKVCEVARNCDTVIYSDIKVMCQGDAPNSTLAENFKNDKNSILVATRSFFTGIDIPGEALRCVAIDKFPFPVPNDPVVKRIGEMDSNAFFNYSIPVMITTFKQAVGRGVRSIDDKCVIVIMDKRIKTARYRHSIIKSFNNKKTSTRDPAEVANFLGVKRFEKEQISVDDPFNDPDDYLPF